MSLQENINLGRHTYFNIGGPARFFVEVSSERELRDAVAFAKKEKLPTAILGAASNVLVADHGFAGLVIRIMLRHIERRGTKLIVGAGVPDAIAVACCIKEELAGFEWAIGIPGTIGGSVRGNAGCFSSEMRDVVERVKVFNTKTDSVEFVDNAACTFGYRESMFKHSPHLIILEVELSLRKGNAETIQKLVRFYTSLRTGAQDIGSASAGCVFKNIPWPREEYARERLLRHFPQLASFINHPVIPAGFIIDHVARLKGRTIGQVSISKKHGNYFINHGGATAEEVLMLVGLVKEYVHRKSGLHLEEEIQLVGF